jgi:hypothetical protein
MGQLIQGLRPDSIGTCPGYLLPPLRGSVLFFLLKKLRSSSFVLLIQLGRKDRERTQDSC